jgi:Bacterial RNA polymerase, alpha chain C terminal domain
LFTYSRDTHGQLLRPKEAVEHLRQKHTIDRTTKTLAVDRVRGGGPPFIRVERSVRYPEMLLDEWAAQRNAVEVRQITPVQVGRPSLPLTPDTLVHQLPISTRAKNALRRADLSTVEDLLDRSDADLLAIDAIGERSLAQIRTLLGALSAPRSMRARHVVPALSTSNHETGER